MGCRARADTLRPAEDQQQQRSLVHPLRTAEVLEGLCDSRPLRGRLSFHLSMVIICVSGGRQNRGLKVPFRAILSLWRDRF